MKGAAPDLTWLGLHVIQIKSTNGIRDSSEFARGQGGLFKSVLSDPLEIAVIDPCLHSIVNFDEGLIIDELLVPPGDDLLTLN